MPHEWQSTTVVRHLDAPYSDEALAVPHKDWIDVCAVDFVGFQPAPNGYGDNRERVKQSGQDFDVSTHPLQYHKAHKAFMTAARLILGDEKFLDSEIDFDHAYTHLDEGQVHSFDEPHMDGTHPDLLGDKKLLRLVGVAMNEVQCGVWQGAVKKQDFGIKGTHLLNGRVKARKLHYEQIPTNRLAIFGPALIHFGQAAPREIEQRHVLRWQLFF